MRSTRRYTSRARVVSFAGWRKMTSALSSESNELAFLFSCTVRSVAGSLNERMPSGGIRPAGCDRTGQTEFPTCGSAGGTEFRHLSLATGCRVDAASFVLSHLGVDCAPSVKEDNLCSRNIPYSLRDKQVYVVGLGFSSAVPEASVSAMISSGRGTIPTAKQKVETPGLPTSDADMCAALYAVHLQLDEGSDTLDVCPRNAVHVRRLHERDVGTSVRFLDVRELYVVVVFELCLPFTTLPHVVCGAIAEVIQLLCGMLTDTMYRHQRFRRLVPLVMTEIV